MSDKTVLLGDRGGGSELREEHEKKLAFIADVRKECKFITCSLSLHNS